MRSCTIIASILLAVCITNIHSLEEEKENATGADIIITEMEPLKRIEVRASSNATSTVPESPTVIHQGNNLYIKPKFIFGSPFTSYKQGSNYNNTNIVTGTPLIPQMPTVVVPPVMTLPVIEEDISIPPPRFPVQLQPPMPPYPCQNMMVLKVPNDIPVPCPPIMVPVSPNPQLPKFPIVQNPVRPVVIPKPPELPPIVLPKLPIEVLVKIPPPDRPVIRPIPEQPVIVPPLCPTMVRCTPPKQALPSIPDIFSAIFQKFKNLLDLPSRIDFSSFLVTDERENDKDLTPTVVFPTKCAQGIVAERVVPNIVKNDEVKVIVSPIFPSQSSFYLK